MGSRFLLQGIFPTQGSNLGFPHMQTDSLASEPPGKPDLFLQVKSQDCSGGSVVKSHEYKRTHVLSLGWEVPLEKEMESTPIFLPGKSHGQRSLVSYSPWGGKELDTTERTHIHTHTHVHDFTAFKTFLDLLHLNLLGWELQVIWQSKHHNWSLT